MNQINPTLPTVGAALNTWGDTLNTALGALVAQGNASDTRLGKLEPPAGSPSGLVATTNGSGGISYQTPASAGTSSTPPATTTTQGAIKLAGHLAGTADSPQLATLFSGALTVGSATRIPVITRDAFGRITALSDVAQQVGSGTVTGPTMANPMTTLGDLIVGGTSGAPLRLAGSTLAARRFLRTTGTGSAAATPSWDTISTSDIIGLAAMMASVSRVVLITATSYIPVAADAGATIEMNNTTANALTIPPNSAVPYPIGTYFFVRMVGTGVTSIVSGTGVQLRAPYGNSIPVQYAQFRVEQRALNEWVLIPMFATVTTGTGGNTGGGTGGGGTTDPGSANNIIADGGIQNASDPSKFTAGANSVQIDSSISKSGGSSIKVLPGDPTQQPIYIAPATASQWAPVTPGTTYTGFLSIRRTTTLAYPADVYLIWYDTSGNQLGISNQGTVTNTVQGSWVQLSVAGAAPANAKYAGILLEIPITAGTLASTDIFNIDEIGINVGANTTWTSTASGSTPPTGSATVGSAGFTYTGGWQDAAGTTPAEKYSGTSGDIASISFTVGTGGGTFSFRGVEGNGNGTAAIKIDSGTSTTVSEAGTFANNAVQYTSGNLTAGNHTATITVGTPDFSIQGADLSNGAFIAPNSNTGGGSGSTNPATNPSGAALPASNAYSGYTRVLAEDFAVDAPVGTFASTAQYAGWNGYDGGTSGDSGTVWSSAKTLSVANGMMRMRQFKDSTGIYTPAVTPAINGDPWSGQQYGKWIARHKTVEPSQYWKTAWLLWPNTGNWNDGEIDFPEQFFDSKIRVNVHENTGNPVNNTGASSTVTMGDNAWHTTMIEIDPGIMKFSVDGTVIFTTTDAKYIPKVPFRWALQNEMDPGTIPVGAEANIYVDWLAVFKRN